MFGFRYWPKWAQDDAPGDPPVVEEISESEDVGKLKRSTKAVVEEPNDEGGFHSPQHVGRQNSEPFRWFGSSFFDEPFFSRPFFNDPFKWSGGFFGGWFSSPWWGPNASSSQQEAPTFSAESSAEGGDFSYTCRTTTGGIGEPSVVHTVSAQGSAADGMHMRETVWDARSGETTVVREESRPPADSSGNNNPNRGNNDHGVRVIDIK